MQAAVLMLYHVCLTVTRVRKQFCQCVPRIVTRVTSYIYVTAMLHHIEITNKQVHKVQQDCLLGMCYVHVLSLEGVVGPLGLHQLSAF